MLNPNGGPPQWVRLSEWLGVIFNDATTDENRKMTKDKVQFDMNETVVTENMRWAGASVLDASDYRHPIMSKTSWQIVEQIFLSMLAASSGQCSCIESRVLSGTSETQTQATSRVLR